MVDLKKRVAGLLKPLSSNKITYPFFNLLNRFSLFGLFGDEWDFTRNGEILCLSFLKTKLGHSIVVFDVGANEGTYSEVLLNTFMGDKREIVIHGFEPATDTFARYASRFKNNQNVICNNAGLGDMAGMMRLHKSSDSSGFASLYNENKFNFDSFEDIKLTTVDEYCLANNIKIIDFLKMDVEGHELAVLRGATQMLKSKRIRAIQFEFGAGNISARTYFKDFYDLLAGDFLLYRIVNNGLVPVVKYDYSLEIFGRVTNYLGILKESN